MKHTKRLPDAFIVAGIVVLGLLIRLTLAPLPGFEPDVDINQGWGQSAVELGLAQSYVEQVNGNMLPNYAPFTIMLFTSMAYVQHWFFDGFDNDPMSYRILIKLPTILAELASIICFYIILKKWKGRRAGLLAALLYAIHPAVLHNGAFWGQTDSIFTFFMVAAMGAFAYNKSMLTGVLFALALLSKMQAVLLLPLFFVLYLRGGWKMFLDGVIGGLAVTIPIMIPFAIGGTFDTVVEVYTNSVGYYSIVSSAAYNFWWSLLSDSAGTIQDTDVLFGIGTYRNIGLTLFGIAYAYSIAVLWRHLKPGQGIKILPALALASAFIAHSFFLWNTQMHERYLFPFVAVGLPMVFIDRKAALIYLWISVFFLVNLMGWLPVSPVDRALYDHFTSLDVFIASAQVIVYFQFAYYLWNYRKNYAAPKAISSMEKRVKLFLVRILKPLFAR